MALKYNKRGQVTIFIIIAVVVIAFIALAYFVYPKIKTSFETDTKNPQAFIEACVKDELKENVELISLQGGSLEPEHYFLYMGDKIEYSCYTNEYYKTCIVQQPMLKQHIEKELQNPITPQVEACFNSLKSNYEEKGHDVIIKPGEVKIELLPKKIIGTFDYEVTLTKDGTEKYKEFNVILNNNLYELVSIANSIIEWETTYGDSDPAIYMTYYKDLKVEKKIQQDSTTIYILTNRDNGGKFQFASRSVAYPPGI